MVKFTEQQNKQLTPTNPDIWKRFAHQFSLSSLFNEEVLVLFVLNHYMSTTINTNHYHIESEAFFLKPTTNDLQDVSKTEL